MIGIDPKTLRKHYRQELDLGHTKANIILTAPDPAEIDRHRQSVLLSPGLQSSPCLEAGDDE